MAKTSLSHPLEIAEIAAPLGAGRIGVTLCPGKHQAGAYTGDWARNLAADLDAISAWGARCLVSLVTDREMVELKVPELGREAAGRGMVWAHLPIEDYSAPTADWERQWARERMGIHKLLDGDGRVVVHCKGGLGRAGTIAALILIERGEDPRASIRAVRAVRPGAVETGAQERFLIEASRSEWRSAHLS